MGRVDVVWGWFGKYLVLCCLVVLFIFGFVGCGDDFRERVGWFFVVCWKWGGCVFLGRWEDCSFVVGVWCWGVLG